MIFAGNRKRAGPREIPALLSSSHCRRRASAASGVLEAQHDEFDTQPPPARRRHTPFAARQRRMRQKAAGGFAGERAAPAGDCATSCAGCSAADVLTCSHCEKPRQTHPLDARRNVVRRRRHHQRGRRLRKEALPANAADVPEGSYPAAATAALTGAVLVLGVPRRRRQGARSSLDVGDCLNVGSRARSSAWRAGARARRRGRRRANVRHAAEAARRALSTEIMVARRPQRPAAEMRVTRTAAGRFWPCRSVEPCLIRTVGVILRTHQATDPSARLRRADGLEDRHQFGVAGGAAAERAPASRVERGRSRPLVRSRTTLARPPCAAACR